MQPRHCKHEILESLELMDATQMEKALQYMKGLVNKKNSAGNYQKFRAKALHEIRRGLKEYNF